MFVDRYDVLLLALSKRWTVNYGFDSKGARRVAGPFRYKDTPAENTEFAHADLTILLTQLSYYYSGLSIAQLDEIFYRLLPLESSADSGCMACLRFLSRSARSVG